MNFYFLAPSSRELFCCRDMEEYFLVSQKFILKSIDLALDNPSSSIS